MMDTDAIYLEVCNYGRSCRSRNVADEADHFERIIRHLDEADSERQELLATNERLVDEVNELKAKLTEKASLLRGCYARINGLEKAVTAAHDHIDMAALEVSHYKDAAIIRAALEKKHEGT